MASGRLVDYLGKGLAADRPVSLSLHPNALGLYYATDTLTISVWEGTAWDNVTSAGDVVGPVSSVNNNVALFDGVTGKLLKDGGALGTAAFTASTDYATAAQGALADTAVQPGDLGTAATTAATDYATAAQGVLADSAIQPGDLATVATTGAYADLVGAPTLGTAAAANTGDFATAAQGALADTAIQSADLATVATTGDVDDLVGFPGGTTDFLRADGTFAAPVGAVATVNGDTGAVIVAAPIIVAVSDETTALTTGTAKVTFRMPYAFTLTGVRASVNTAPTGSVLTVDINEGGVSILSTKLTIDATEKTSTTAATAAVISDTALADDAEITIDIDTVGSTVAGAGLKVTLLGYAS